MLQNINIKNFALIDDLNVNLEQGLNVITGETGSGKSMLLAAINFGLGGKGDKNFIQADKECARVSLCFNNVNKRIFEALNELGVDAEEDLVIARKLNSDGKSENRINGVLVTLSMLKGIASKLIDAYGQYEHQTLLDVSTHMVFLDKFLGPEAENCKNALSKLFAQKREIEAKIKSFGGNPEERAREKDMLAFQIEEIETADLQADEEEQLNELKLKFQNVQKITSAITSTREMLSECIESNAYSNVYNANKILTSIASLDKNLNNLSERIRSVEIEVDDISNELKNVLSEYDFSEIEFERVDNRLDLIKNFKKKYGADISAIQNYCAQAKVRLADLEDCESAMERAESNISVLECEIAEICAKLSKLRQNGAIKLKQAIENELKDLGMRNAKFDCEFTECKPCESGGETMQFLFTANLGQPYKPLIKVISGGEMSRFMLAFKIVMRELDEADTLIFDEIDSGISGKISLEVGKKMAALASKIQILTVTHLATISSFASSHYLINKTVRNGKTVSGLAKLNNLDIIKEIARLAGGKNDSAAGLMYAEELKIEAQNYRNSLK